MECGGFIRGMGHETMLIVRSTPLRNFDQDMVGRVVESMEDIGVKFLMKTAAKSFHKQDDGRVKVVWESLETKEEHSDTFDTVLQAIGRYADSQLLRLDAVGVKHQEGKIIIDRETMKTTAPSIYAVGDVCQGSPELTPVAIREGTLLADRLFAGEKESVEYDLIATTIFTPLEYSCIGLSEERAVEKLGKDKVEVYHIAFKPYEWNLLYGRKNSICYTKMVVDISQQEKVIGLHYIGPNAGEVMQGYAVAVTAGLTKAAFDKTIAIHPTCAEEIVYLSIKKSEQPHVVKEGCCG